MNRVLGRREEALAERIGDRCRPRKAAKNGERMVVDTAVAEKG
jgi:hypothetical protein